MAFAIYNGRAALWTPSPVQRVCSRSVVLKRLILAVCSLLCNIEPGLALRHRTRLTSFMTAFRL